MNTQQKESGRKKWYDNEPICEHETPPKTAETMHEQMNALLNPMTNEYIEYRKIMKIDLQSTWEPMMSIELGRLSQGWKETKGTETIHFIPWKLFPQNKKLVYVRICCDYCPQKEQKHRVRITVGGNRVH